MGGVGAMQPADDAPRVGIVNNNEIATGTNNRGYDRAPVKPRRRDKLHDKISCMTRSVAWQHQSQSPSFNFTNTSIWDA
jgi:hypothetical protein